MSKKKNNKSNAFLSKRDRKKLINAINNVNVYDEDSAFDLGKLLRDYGFKIIYNVIREKDCD